MTFINEHKILGDDDSYNADVTKRKEVRAQDLDNKELLIQILNELKKIEYHLAIATDTNL